mmetsp:Transcript_87254/g.246129  ORF Transcript_87254/g.246129 Transcript_87254/m.246129 type:complete len:96 (-) Transcript_87254:125-412(-)
MSLGIGRSSGKTPLRAWALEGFVKQSSGQPQLRNCDNNRGGSRASLTERAMREAPAVPLCSRFAVKASALWPSDGPCFEELLLLLLFLCWFKGDL